MNLRGDMAKKDWGLGTDEEQDLCCQLCRTYLASVRESWHPGSVLCTQKKDPTFANSHNIMTLASGSQPGAQFLDSFNVPDKE